MSIYGEVWVILPLLISLSVISYNPSYFLECERLSLRLNSSFRPFVQLLTNL